MIKKMDLAFKNFKMISFIKVIILMENFMDLELYI